MVTSQTRQSVKGTIAATGIELADQYRCILDTFGNRYRQLTSWTFGQTNNEGFDEYVVDHDEYLGVGSGAFSFLNNSLYVKLSVFAATANALLQAIPALSAEESSTSTRSCSTA